MQEVSTLQPGQSIRPNLTMDQAKLLIKENFGRDVVKIKELNSYDDKNYYVETTDNGEPGGNRFVFKVLNSMDTLKTGHIDAEHKLMFHLASRKVDCPVPQKTLQGKTYSTVSIPSNDDENNGNETSLKHLIRLLTFVEGKIMYDVPISAKLLYKAGAYCAQLQNYFKELSCHALEDHQSIWMLANVLDVEKFLYVIEDQPDNHKMVKEILESFRLHVLPKMDSFEGGIIHGDFNEQNVLVRPSTQDEGDYDLCGIIDFGDCQSGPYVFELAIAICYMMLESVRCGIVDPFDSVSHVVSGYSEHRKVPLHELKVLRTLVACRFVQSLVYGAYTNSQDPTNQYVLTTAGRGWKLMDQIWNGKTDEEFISISSKLL